MTKLLGLGVVVLLAIAMAPKLAPHDPLEANLGRRLEPPSQTYWLGTDDLGRCQLSRTLAAAPRSIGLAVLIAAGVNLLALTMGAFSVFGGRTAHLTVTTCINVLISFPSLVFALAVVGIAGPSLTSVALAIMCSWWPAEARIARSLLQSARNRDYVDATILSGLPMVKVIWRHVLPMVLPALAVRFSLEVGGIILALSTLGFLGLGTQPPFPEWGMMLSDARPYAERWPHLLFAPGLALFLCTLTCNLFAESLRSRIDPRCRHDW